VVHTDTSRPERSVDNGIVSASCRPGPAPTALGLRLRAVPPTRVTYSVGVLARLLTSALSGLSLWLAFPGYDLWPLAIAGAGGLALALCGVSVRRGLLIGLVGGLAFFVPLLSWSGIYVGALPWLSLATLSALYVAAFGAVTAYLQGGPDARVRPLAVALAWTVAELARATTPFGGFPWGRLGFSQADSPVLGLARWLGVPGVGFTVVLTGALLALAGQVLVRDRDLLRAGLYAVLAVVLVLSPLLVPRPADGEPVQVLGIQGNVPEVRLDFNAQRRAVLDNHVGTTLEAVERIEAGELPAPDLVVWPENASDIDPLRNADAATIIDDAVTRVDAPVVVGAVLREPGDNLSNVSMLYLPGEGPVQRYTKLRPVPFGEYIPYRSFFRSITETVDLVPRDFVAGTEVGVLQVPTDSGDLPLGVAICFEVVIDDVMRDTVLAGAEVVAVPTNNATFGFTDESVQQLAASRVKAVELGRSVVHISTVGVSGLVAPDGSVSHQTELFTQAIISGEVTRRTEITPAVRLGAWPDIAAAAALGLLVVLTGVQRRRETHR
jgi:apolipoprotein N-acyltransferase